jgi:hypothetical protein
LQEVQALILLRGEGIEMNEFQISKKTLETEPQPTPDQDRDAMLTDLAYRMTLLELGVSE